MKLHVHINGHTGPTGSGNELGEGFHWADAKLYIVDGTKPLGEQFKLITTIEVVGKTKKECAEKIAKIAKEKYSVDIPTTTRKVGTKVEYVSGFRLVTPLYKEGHYFVKQKEILGSGSIETQD